MHADTAESRRFISFTHSHVFSIINRESRLCSYRNKHAYTWYLWFWVCQVCCGVVCFWDDWADFGPESWGMASSRKTCLVWPTPSLAVMEVSLSLTDSCRNKSVFVFGIVHHCVTESKGKRQKWLQSSLAVWTVLANVPWGIFWPRYCFTIAQDGAQRLQIHRAVLHKCDRY